MYSMPNDMRGGRLPEGMEEHFPYHVYMKRGPGVINMGVYWPSDEVQAWLDEHVAKEDFDFRKNIGEREPGAIWGPMEPVFCFKREDDAFAFKMRWGGL